MAFIYHNTNPNGYHIPDCVVRAICLATNISYFDVISMLHFNALMFNCDDLNLRCYEKLLDDDLQLKHYIGNNKTAQEVANDFPNNKILLRMDGHLSYAEHGNIYDIWDCSNEIITDFWIL